MCFSVDGLASLLSSEPLSDDMSWHVFTMKMRVGVQMRFVYINRNTGNQAWRASRARGVILMNLIFFQSNYNQPATL